MSKTDNKAEFLTEEGVAYDIPEEGSLGLLALGYSGIMIWREKRQQAKMQRLKQKNGK